MCLSCSEVYFLKGHIVQSGDIYMCLDTNLTESSGIFYCTHSSCSNSEGHRLWPFERLLETTVCDSACPQLLSLPLNEAVAHTSLPPLFPSYLLLIIIWAKLQGIHFLSSCLIMNDLHDCESVFLAFAEVNWQVAECWLLSLVPSSLCYKEDQICSSLEKLWEVITKTWSSPRQVGRKPHTRFYP